MAGFFYCIQYGLETCLVTFLYRTSTNDKTAGISSLSSRYCNSRHPVVQ